MTDTDTDTDAIAADADAGAQNYAPDEVVEPDEGDKNLSPDAPADDESSSDENEPEPDMFPRSYVEELREENKRYRYRAQRADDYAQRLHTELIRGTGRLADPTDLVFDETHIDNPEALTAAIDDLLVRKPHLAARRPTGEIGQGATKSADTVNLAALLRRQAL